MARWRLRNAHYLNITELDGTSSTQWEHKEATREGRQRRQVYNVPRLLDPNDPGDCNYDGDCIVAYEGSGFPRDFIFASEPTPEMEPLDDEAKKISASLEAKWKHPIESLPANGDYGQALMAQFEQQMQKLIKGGAAVSTKGVDDDRISAMEKQLTELMHQNAMLMEQLAKPKAEARRA